MRRGERAEGDRVGKTRVEGGVCWLQELELWAKSAPVLSQVAVPKTGVTVPA